MSSLRSRYPALAAVQVVNNGPFMPPTLDYGAQLFELGVSMSKAYHAKHNESLAYMATSTPAMLADYDARDRRGGCGD